VKHRIVVSAAVLLFAAAPAPAAERIGYVDMQRVVTESAAGKRAKAEIEGVAKQKQEQVDRERRKLQAQQQALEKEQLTLTETQKRTKQRDFERKLQAYQQLAAEAQREIGQKGAERERKVLTDVRAVIREIAHQEKLLMVFEKNAQPVLYAADGPDLTDRVIKAYDARAKN